MRRLRRVYISSIATTLAISTASALAAPQSAQSEQAHAAGSMSIATWREAVVERAANAPLIVASRAAATAAEGVARIHDELEPLQLSVDFLGERPEYPSFAGPSSIWTSEARASKYVGGGVDVAGRLRLTRQSAFDDGLAGRVGRAWEGEAGIDIGADLWRDRFGRANRAQRYAPRAAARAAALDAEADRQAELAELLATAIGVCRDREVLAQTTLVLDQAEALVQEQELRYQAKLIPAPDILQFRNLVLGLRRSVATTQANLRAGERVLAARFGLRDLPPCPTLALGSETSSTDDFGKPPLIAAGTERVSQQRYASDAAILTRAPILRPFVGVTARSIGSSAGDAFDSTDGDSWGLAFGVNFFWTANAARDRLTARASRLALAAAEAALTGTRQRLRGEVDALGEQRNGIAAAYAIAAEQVENTREQISLYKARYELRRTSAFVVVGAFQAYLGSSIELPRLVSQWYQALWSEMQLRGEL